MEVWPPGAHYHVCPMSDKSDKHGTLALSDADRATAMAYTPIDEHRSAEMDSNDQSCGRRLVVPAKFKTDACKHWLVFALLDCAKTVWVHGATPKFSALLLEEKNRNLIRAEVYHHPDTVREIVHLLDVQWMTADRALKSRWSFMGPDATLEAMTDAVLEFCVGSQKGIVKLVANRSQATVNRANFRDKKNQCDEALEQVRQSAEAVSLVYRHRHREALGHVCADAAGHKHATVVCGIGRPTMVVARTGSAPYSVAAPAGTTWVACDANARLAVSYGSGPVRLHLSLIDWYGASEPSELMCIDEELPPIASVAFMHGGILCASHAGGVTKTPYEEKLVGNPYVRPSILPMPGMWALCAAHRGTTLVCASTQGVVLWPSVCLERVRRVVLVRAWTGAPSRAVDVRKYKRSRVSPTKPIVARDALPPWPSESTLPVPAVMCGEDTLLCQASASTVFSVGVPVLDTVQPYRGDWAPCVWSSAFEGTLLAAVPHGTDCRQACVATTTGVYVGVHRFVQLPVCTSAAWMRPGVVLRDGTATVVCTKTASFGDAWKAHVDDTTRPDALASLLDTLRVDPCAVLLFTELDKAMAAGRMPVLTDTGKDAHVRRAHVVHVWAGYIASVFSDAKQSNVLVFCDADVSTVAGITAAAMMSGCDTRIVVHMLTVWERELSPSSFDVCAVRKEIESIVLPDVPFAVYKRVVSGLVSTEPPAPPPGAVSFSSTPDWRAASMLVINDS